jgi:opacity protein-like surface antigen
MKKLALVALAACLSTAAVVPESAQAQAPAPAQGSGAGVRAGYLNCQVARGVGLVFGMTRNLTCTYAPSGGTPETYVGEIQQYGVNLGFIERGIIVWVVVAPTANIEPGSLAGNYGGVAAGVALGYGLGANALFGGSSSQFGLQPVSLEGMQGLNIAAGIAGLSLRSTRARPARTPPRAAPPPPPRSQ